MSKRDEKLLLKDLYLSVFTLYFDGLNDEYASSEVYRAAYHPPHHPNWKQFVVN